VDEELMKSLAVCVVSVDVEVTRDDPWFVLGYLTRYLLSLVVTSRLVSDSIAYDMVEKKFSLLV